MRKRSIIQSFTQKCLTIIIWVPLACSCGNSKKCCNNVIVPGMVISLSTKQNLYINILLLTLNNAVLKIKSVSFFFLSLLSVPNENDRILLSPYLCLIYLFACLFCYILPLTISHHSIWSSLILTTNQV